MVLLFKKCSKGKLQIFHWNCWFVYIVILYGFGKNTIIKNIGENEICFRELKSDKWVKKTTFFLNIFRNFE